MGEAVPGFERPTFHLGGWFLGGGESEECAANLGFDQPAHAAANGHPARADRDNAQVKSWQ